MENPPSSKGMTLGLSLLFGLVLGGMTESVDGFVIGAMLGALFAQVLFLRARVLRLGEELSELRGTQVAGREPGIEKPAPAERAQPEFGVKSQASPSGPVAATSSSTPRADAIEKRI